MKKLMLVVSVAFSLAAMADVIYVTPVGTGSGATWQDAANIYDAFANAAELDEFRREMTDGDVLVLFLSPELYRQVKGSLVPLKEIFGEKPWCAADDYAIELWLTDFYNYFTAAQELPEDTLICVRRASEMKSYTKSRAEEADEKARTLVKDIVEFASPVTQEQ